MQPVSPGKKKLLVICPYPEGVAPSQRLKFEQYFEAFRKDGWDITVESFISKRFWKIIYNKGFVLQKIIYTLSGYAKRIMLLAKVSKYNVVYAHLWATPFGPPLYETILAKLSNYLVYDIDDLVYLRSVKNDAHPLVSWIKGRKKPIYLMKQAQHVITCTPYLDDFVKSYNKNTTDISSTVDTDNRYKVVNTYSNEKGITLGWSGSLSTSKYFYLLTAVLKELRKTHSFEVLVMGDPSVSIDGITIHSIPWKEEYEIENLQKIDIGLYPLPDEEWVYGKSGLKAIQYMALGIPTVATAIGANFRVIENGVSGFLVNSDEDWLVALKKLIEDASLRKRIGLAGRKRAEDLFSVKANTDKYLSILNLPFRQG